MTYALLDANGTLVSYPVRPQSLSPHISFPDNWAGGTIDDKVYVRVYPTAAPANLFVSEAQYVSEGNPAPDVNGVWRQTWNATVKSTDELKAMIQQKRQAHEDAGVLHDGRTYYTDTTSQIAYVGALMAAQQSAAANIAFSINWKSADGFVTLSAADLISVTTAVRGHIQACFDQEANLVSQVLAANNDPTAILAIDFNAGWPT